MTNTTISGSLGRSPLLPCIGSIGISDVIASASNIFADDLSDALNTGWYKYPYFGATFDVTNESGAVRLTKTGYATYANILFTHPNIESQYNGRFKVKLVDGSGLGQIHFRQKDINNFLLFWINGTDLKLSRRLGGSLTDIWVQPIASGNNNTLQVECDGSSVTVTCWDSTDTQVATHTITDIWTSDDGTWVLNGLGCNSTALFSNFEYEA